MPSNEMNRRRFLARTAAISPLLCTGLLSPLRAGVTALPTLERQLLERAPQFISHFGSIGCFNLAVLKFRVKKGTEPISDRVGTLNHSLGDRLSAALILAARHAEPPVGIIANANSVARQRAGATHLTAKGREKFFEDKYELAWKSPPVVADAFLTGKAITGPTLEELQVVVQWFDRIDGKYKLQPLADFSVPVDANILNELSESFGLRGGFDGGEVTIQEATEAAVAVKNGIATRFPLELHDSPIKLDVLYDGNIQRVELRDGKAFVCEPQAGQKVEFVLRRTNPRDGKLGVVLKVNGENTLYRERQKDFDCAKWILTADRPVARIAGYQKSLSIAEEFKVLSNAESDRNEVNYGTDVGTFSVSVFREGRSVPDISDEAPDLAAIANPVFPRQKPDDLKSLQNILKPVEQFTSRGLVTDGRDRDQVVETVGFEPAPLPILSATIHYYQRQS